jgi:hypothetical protein
MGAVSADGAAAAPALFAGAAALEPPPEAGGEFALTGFGFAVFAAGDAAVGTGVAAGARTGCGGGAICWRGAF